MEPAASCPESCSSGMLSGTCEVLVRLCCCQDPCGRVELGVSGLGPCSRPCSWVLERSEVLWWSCIIRIRRYPGRQPEWPSADTSSAAGTLDNLAGSAGG